MRHFSRIVVRNSVFGMVAQLAIKFLTFGFSVLIVRNLGAETYGQYAGILAFVSVFAIISDLGLSPYAVREIARWRDTPDGLARTGLLYGNVLFLRLLLSLLAILLVITTAWLTERPLIMVGAIGFCALGLTLYSIHGASDALLAGFERLDLSAGAKVVNQLVFVLVGGLALWWGIGYYGLIFANLLGVSLMAWICWKRVRTLGVRPQTSVSHSWRPLLRASLPFGIIGFTLGLSYAFDTVLLSIFRGDQETGYYNAAYNLVFSTALLSNVINTSLYPSLTRQASHLPQTLPAIYERALRYLMVLALPIAVGGWALADEIVPFLFTNDYLPAVLALQIVIWVVPLMFASEFMGYMVVIAGNEGRVARAIMVSTSVNVMLNLLLVPRFGFIIAAIMTVITEAVLVGQYIWMLPQLRQLDWRNYLLRPLLAAIFMGGIVLLVREYMPLLLTVATGAIVYLVFLLVLGVIGKAEISFVRGIPVPAEEITAQ